MLLESKNVHKSYGPHIVLKGISFGIDTGNKVGLVGPNGSGKSTLLKILAGKESPDFGKIITGRKIKVAYVPQEISLVSKKSIEEYVREDDPNIEDYKIKIVLTGLGFGDIGLSHKINDLSSGQRSKVALIKALLSRADIMLFDEPTNNLDLTSIIWLEKFIKDMSSACIVVSHDRTFIDNIVKKVFEIDWFKRTLNVTHGKYSSYLERKKLELEREWFKYNEEQEEASRLHKEARRMKGLAIKGSKTETGDKDKMLRGFRRNKSAASARKASIMHRRAQRIKRTEKPLEKEAFSMEFFSKEGGPIQLNDLIGGYGERKIFGPINTLIKYRDKVVFLGKNGSGKSTLLKTITGKLQPISGMVSFDNTIVIGDLMQEHEDLPRKQSVKNFLIKKENIPEEDIYDLFIDAGFEPEEINKKIEALSPGGRARLLLALFTYRNVNTLVLDEPTNHLDIDAIIALEDAIKGFTGTVILVSHDRWLLSRLSWTDIYRLDSGSLVREDSFESYLSTSEKEASKLIRTIDPRKM